MALVAHRMMLPARRRRTHQQVARNKVGVLLVPSVAEYCGSEQPQLQPQAQHQPVGPTASQLQYNLEQHDAESGNGKHIEPAAYVEVRSGNQLQMPIVDPLHHSAGLRVNEIIRQAAKEYELKKMRHFGRESAKMG